MIVFWLIQLYQTKWFHAILLPELIEFSRCIGTYSSAKFELNSIEPEIKKESVVFFSNDEIVLDVTENGYSGYVKTVIFNGLSQFSDPFPLFKIESFILHSIPGTDGYYKEIHSENGEITYKFKCLNSYMLPFVIRKFRGEEVKESDKVFYHNGALAKYIEVPQIEIK